MKCLFSITRLEPLAFWSAMFVLAMVPVVLPSCERTIYKTEYEIPEERRAEAAKALIELCKVSNPMSDEESEDMIEQAERTILKLYGEKVRYEADSSPSGSYNWKRMDP